MKTKNLIAFKIFYLIVGLIGLSTLSYWTLVFWFIFAIGNGTVGHRYFAHNAFVVSRPMHWIMSIWCTLSAYSPPSYWQIQHRHHHRNSDKETDIHSPKRGWVTAFIGWTLSPSLIDSVFKDRASIVSLANTRKDKALILTNDYFISINFLFLLCLFLIDTNLVLASATACLIEHVRLGLINTLCHLKSVPGNYRNHNTKDNSQNNLFLGWIGLGFGWHNNHHHDAGRLSNQDRWWEIDIEGLVGLILSKF